MVCIDHQFQIGKDEAVAGDNFAWFDRQGAVEHGTGVDAGVEFAIFAAGIGGGGQVGEELVIELAAGEIGGERLGVDAGEAGAQAGLDHLAGELAGRDAPHGKDGLEPGTFELFLAVGADVAEEEIAEGDAINAFADGLRANLAHDAFVVFVRAGRGEIDVAERKVGGTRLRPDDLAADPVHGDAVGFTVEGGEQADDFILRLLAQQVESPGAVFAAAPGKEGTGHGGDFRLAIVDCRFRFRLATLPFWIHPDFPRAIIPG